ncbi:MAG: exo-alpha-sialidase [Prevotella sp.]|nr:exo-alpha-sialidase [Prevotella sp.]
MEGPTTVKVPEGWLIYYDRYELKDFGAHLTTDFKSFTDVSKRVSVPPLHKHGTIFKAPEHIVNNLLHNSDRVHYTGTTLSNPERHDGGLSPVVGVHNIQILRANREHPTAANGGGWTYNHQPMMAYWNDRFYVHYLSDPSDEHVPPSHTMMQTSADGYHWTEPQVLFPELTVPEGFQKPGRPEQAHNLIAIMHQRVGWYVAKDGTLLAIGNYGVAFDRKDDPNDGNGIGRVVREVKKDGTLGPIYFIYFNHTYKQYKPQWPYYTKADKAVRRACEEILANPRYRMQWVEEADRNDPLIPLNKAYKAYCDYTLPDGRLVALWKHALTALSTDGGQTWSQPVERARGFVNSNAKIWGQRLSDGSYATIYNPSEYRWPLGISLSADGLEYQTLNLVCGEVPPMRYGGNYKSYGPQYVRGIQEGNGLPKDSDLWVSYSMNKEDMWVARIPVPVRTEAIGHANDDFKAFKTLSELTDWNIYSPVMAPVGLADGWLTLTDSDPFDYARVERKIPASQELRVAFDLRAAQNDHGLLQIEFLDHQGTACSRIELTADGELRCKGGARYGGLGKYAPDSVYHIEAVLSVKNRLIQVFVNGKKAGQRMFFAPVESIERVMLRTGSRRTFPDIDTPADWYGTLDNAGATDPAASYAIANFRTSSTDASATVALLRYDDYRHYVDHFNTMEDENIRQAIPNADAWQWMTENVPLFDCPQQDFEEMWYYRWWTLRKHIEQTPVGYAMTEFLVNRSYADQYNLIASGVGHHIHESRWLRQPEYLDQIIHTWYHGNDGKPMKKIVNYSSWIAHSLWGRYEVDGRRDWVVSVLPDLEWEYGHWERTHRRSAPKSSRPSGDAAAPLPSGGAGGGSLYWQADVQDAMEETISGGRKKKYLRPSINSYMYGNARAIGQIAALAGDDAKARSYQAKADTIRALAHQCLWNGQHQFFETHRIDSSANVREAIGFLPWYTRMAIDDAKYGVAWLQAADPHGFSAPYGQTTAERRHPLFRTHGVGKCEWDGAVWPFATSQTLTALANFANDYPHSQLAVRNAQLRTDSLYFAELEKYVQSQHLRGRPYIGEYLDEVTGYWLKGDQERSRYYNHSTFCDLVITGLVGLRPNDGRRVTVRPLLPADKWDYFCLDNVRYHGHDLTIVWDRTGQHYHAGRGLSIYVDGRLAAHRDDLGLLQTNEIL